jgi:uncharacterized protein
MPIPIILIIKIMKISNIHLIKGEINVIFHYNSFTLIEVTDLVYDIIERIMNNESIESIAEETKLMPADIETLIINISKSIPNNPNHKKEDIVLEKRRRIDRITLHVANNCNLRCKYCYANGGSYNLPQSMMTKELASKFIDFCTTHFDHINNIVFFGGEPFLNPKIIKFICESFKRLYKKNKIDYLPEWSIITNGTIMNDEILNLIKRYIKSITVSIDGPQNLNDFNRKFVNGEGSYAKIADFIKKVKEETDADLKYEATYTSYHSQNNWSRADVKSFLQNEFNINGTIADDTNYDYEANSSIKSAEMNLPSGFFGILESIASKISLGMCPVGDNIVAISTDGELYSCHMNCGKKHLSLGNISGENFFNSREKYLLLFPYLKSILKTEKPCIDCWANPVCGGCVIRWFYNKETDEYNSLPKNSLCEITKKNIEKILLLIVHLRKDKAKWAKLLEGLSSFDDYDLINI